MAHSTCSFNPVENEAGGCQPTSKMSRSHELVDTQSDASEARPSQGHAHLEGGDRTPTIRTRQRDGIWCGSSSNRSSSLMSW